MTIFIIFIAMMLVGAVLIGSRSDILDTIGFILGVVGGILLFVVLLSLPLTRMEISSQIAEFKTTQVSFDTARKNTGSLPIELAAVQIDVANQNRRLASWKYYNSTVFDIWYPDEVDDLRPIQ